MYVSTLGQLVEVIGSKRLKWMNANITRCSAQLTAEVLSCNLEPSEEAGFQRLKVFAKEQFNSDIISWEIAGKILSRLCRVRKILPEAAIKLTLTETADAIEGSEGLKCPRCGGPLDDGDEHPSLLFCLPDPTESACRTCGHAKP